MEENLGGGPILCGEDFLRVLLLLGVEEIEGGDRPPLPPPPPGAEGASTPDVLVAALQSTNPTPRAMLFTCLEHCVMLIPLRSKDLTGSIFFFLCVCVSVCV